MKAVQCPTLACGTVFDMDGRTWMVESYTHVGVSTPLVAARMVAVTVDQGAHERRVLPRDYLAEAPP